MRSHYAILNERESLILSLRFSGKTLQEVADHFSRSKERIRQLEAKAWAKLYKAQQREKDASTGAYDKAKALESLNLNARTRNALENNGIYNIAQLVATPSEELRNFIGFGSKAYEEVGQAVHKYLEDRHI